MTPTDLRETSPRSYTPKHLGDRILTSRAALEGERKRVTVLFCDLASSTALAGRLGPEAMHTLLNRFFELSLEEVHRYEGTINQFLGDGFMALFGAPIAVEDHARRAVLAAMGIQRSLKEKQSALGAPPGDELSVRMGLNTGLVVVGGIGDNLRMDYTAVGDTTNVAARLQELAEPGTILLSEATARLLQDHVRLEALEPVELKGIVGAVRAYRLLEFIPRRSALEVLGERALSPFVGREREVAALLDLLAQAETGQGQVVGLLGEPGVGKSRLLFEFSRSLEGREITFLEGRCLSYGAAIPYLPVLEILRGNCGITEADGREAIANKVRLTLRKEGMDSDDGAPYLLNLLGVRDGTERLAVLSPEAIKSRTFEILRQIALKGSRERPLVMVFENLQWIDKTSEEYVASLVDSLAGAPILLVGTYRPGYRPPWMDRSYATQVALRRLTPQDSLTVVHSVLAREKLPDSLAELILDRAEGNPFFLEELTRAVLEHEGERPELELPDTVQGVLIARIDRLPDAPKRLLQTASVLGRHVTPKLLEAIWEGPGNLEPHLTELKRLEFLFERTGAEEPVYVFKNALTQEVAYESLLLSRRQALHSAVGRALEAVYPDCCEEYYELLAYHYSHSADANKALEYLDLANQKATNVTAMEEAKAYFDEAMKLLDTLPDTDVNRQQRITLLMNQSIVFMLLFKYPEYYVHLTRYESSAVELGDPGLLGMFYQRLGSCEWAFGNFDQAIQTQRKAAELCEVAENFDGAVSAYLSLEWAHLYKGDYDQVLALKEDVLRMVNQQFNLRIYVWAFAAASWAYSQVGCWGLAAKEAQNALRVAEEFSDDSMISFAAWTISWVGTSKGDLGQALEYAEMAVRKAPTPADKTWAQATLAWTLCRLGEPNKGVDILAALVPLSRAGRFRPSEIPHMLWLGQAYWLAGECDKATQTLEECLELAERCGTKFFIGCSHRILGEIALETNSGRATSHFEQSIAILREIKAENELAMAYSSHSRLYKEQGNIAEARKYLTQALEIFERLGTLIEPDKVRQALAELPEA